MKMSCLRGVGVPAPAGQLWQLLLQEQQGRLGFQIFQEPVMVRSWVTSSTGLLLSQSPAIIEGSHGMKGQNEQRPNSCGNPAGAVWLLGDVNDSYFEGILFTC